MGLEADGMGLEAGGMGLEPTLVGRSCACPVLEVRACSSETKASGLLDASGASMGIFNGAGGTLLELLCASPLCWFAPSGHAMR